MASIKYKERKYKVDNGVLKLNELGIKNIAEIKGLEMLSNLKELWLVENKISEIKGLEMLINLEELYLYGNNISEIKGLITLTNLKRLSLDSNKITEIKGLEMLSNLKELWLVENKISEIKGLEMLINLEELYLYGNDISEIKGLITLTNLKRLSLDSNKITEIKGLETLTNLKELEIGKNPIIRKKFGKELLNRLGGFKTWGHANNPTKFVEYCRQREETIKIIKEKLINIQILINKKQINESLRKLEECKRIAEKECIFSLIEEIKPIFSIVKSQIRKKKQKKLEKGIADIQPLLDKKKFNEYIKKLEEYKRIANTENLTPLIKKINSLLSSAKSIFIEFKVKKIKKTILDLGTKFTRLQINEIAEKCDLKDDQLIINTVLNMIENKEIYAEYFSSSKSVAFNQQANIEEIDKLTEAYKEWEGKKVGKK